MSNSKKLILLSNLKKNKKLSDNKKNKKSEYFFIKSKEIDKLKNPNKGNIFIYFLPDNDYQFFRFTGKKWIEIN